MAKKSVKKVSKSDTKAPEVAVDVAAMDSADTQDVDIVDASEDSIAPKALSEEVSEPEFDDPVESETALEIESAEVIAPAAGTSKARVWPLFVGGIVAAVLGFLAARADLVDNFLPPSLRAGAEQSALAEDLKEANSQIARLNGDVKDLSAKIADQPAPNLSIIDELQATIAQQNERIAKLEERPVGTSGGASSNYDAEFAELQAMAAAQQAEIDALLADARLVEKSTTDAANSTLARAAATRIIAAIESGAPFDAALADLETTGVADIPAALVDAAAEGVVPLSALQSAMPDAARAALAASRSADGKGVSGLGGFLKRSLGARSVEPREGSDPDAVLSRIEDAARNGRLTDALAEADTLPAEGQAAMAGWLEQARTRQSVLSASEALMQSLAAN